MRSVNRLAPARITGCAATVVIAGAGLSGCVSTQRRAARLRVNSDRIRVSQTSTRVATPSSSVSVDAVAVIRDGRRTSFVVTVRNARAATVSDLPISIGYRTGHRRVYLNAGTSSGYFAAHLAAIPGHGSLTWVSAATRRLPRGARPFAIVGATASVPIGAGHELPVVTARTSTGHGNVLRVAVHNASSVPQYQLPVYAVVAHGGRTVAAGEASVVALSGGATQTLRLRLYGATDDSRARLEAPPTILQ